MPGVSRNPTVFDPDEFVERGGAGGGGTAASRMRSPSVLEKAEALDDKAVALEGRIESGNYPTSKTFEKNSATQSGKLRGQASALRERGIRENHPDLVERAQSLGMRDSEISQVLRNEVGNDPDDFSSYLDQVEEWAKASK